MTLAILRSPYGVVEAIQRRAAELGQPVPQILKTAGVTESQWADFVGSLSGLIPDREGRDETFRKIMSVCGLHLEVVESPGPADFVGQVPHGRVNSRFGPLG